LAASVGHKTNCHFLPNSVIFHFANVTSLLSVVKKALFTYFSLTKLNKAFTMELNWIDKALELVMAYAPKFILAIVVLQVGMWLIGKVGKALSSVLQRQKVDDSLRPFLISLIEVGLKVMLLLSVAGMVGIETTSFVAIFGALAFAIGMALQGSLGNFASGVMIMLFRPYKVGDLVTIQATTGDVEGIHMFNTTLLTLDNRRIIIPNSAVTSGTITNISGQGVIRVDMLYAVSPREDLNRVRSVIQSVAAACPQVLKDRGTDILVHDFSELNTRFDVRPWCKSEHYWDVYYFFQENLKKEFTKQGIEAPISPLELIAAH
jgi:small conductance mechanosensitive channel